MVSFGELIEKLARPPEDIRAENLRTWASSVPGTTPISEIEPRKRCKVAGVVQNIRIDPREGSGSIEATIIDGTGELVVRWLGRQSMSGITLGAGLVVEGICGVSESGGQLVILNPEYDLIADPEHG